MQHVTVFNELDTWLIRYASKNQSWVVGAIEIYTHPDCRAASLVATLKFDSLPESTRLSVMGAIAAKHHEERERTRRMWRQVSSGVDEAFVRIMGGT